MKAVLKFEHPVKFEGSEIKEIDLSALEGWSSLKYTQTVNKMQAAGDYPTFGSIEGSAQFAWYVGAEVSGLPVEFFQTLSPKYIRGISIAIMKNFTLTADDLEKVLRIDGSI